MSNYKKVLTEIARVYNEAMNIIHYMHDKYCYEKLQMALHDIDPHAFYVIQEGVRVGGNFGRHLSS